jgi:hypothetical protein
MPKLTPLLVTVVLVSVSVQTSWAQTVREAIPADSEPEFEVREDGTTILRGDRIPDFLAVQNFFFTAHSAAQLRGQHWQFFLENVGIDPSSEPAAILSRRAQEVWNEAAQGGVSPLGGENNDERLVQLVAEAWVELRRSLLAADGSTDEVSAYINGTIRRQTMLIVPPDSEQDLSIAIPNLETVFQEALEQLEEDGRK